MAGETALATLLRSMSPQLNAGDYVFCTLADNRLPDCEVIGSFREQEGLTVIVERQQAEQAGLAFEYVAAWITLNVHSALEAVGLTAAFDPLKEPPPKRGSFLYLRPLWPRMGTLSVDNLDTIRRSLDERPAYLVFSHREAFRDAERLIEPRRR